VWDATVEPYPDDPRRQLEALFDGFLARAKRKLAREAGATEPEALGDALMLLLEGGCYTLSTFHGTTGPIAAMAKGARALIRAHLDEG
jgi:hypothetical protein